MVIFEVYSDCLKNTFKARLCSKATLLVFILNVVQVVLPFVLAYKSKGFWLKHDTFFEQPDVRFNGEYVFLAKTSNQSRPILCTNLPVSREVAYFDVCNTIKVRELDHNFDGKMDGFDAFIKIDLPNELKVTSFDLILMLHYKLHAYCRFEMQSIIIYQTNLPNEINEFDIIADLYLRQTSPIFCHSKRTNINYNYSVIKESTEENMYNVKKIIREYLERNVTTHLTNIYTSYSTNGDKNLDVSLHLSYPFSSFYYQPGFWQIIKVAWMQYLSIYLIMAFMINKLKQYVFKNRLILYYTHSPLKKEQ